eukprot:TRINITY_DN63055_c0_g1_i1.p1 TRINITY_DN63055_c0_g1~~TRINITY_DN63055_c0_g1_i1.p1  ORF type:complete len:345 (-),score=50.30 TRINITY_DN63055_c0_g1_i1:113-1147(-)
MMGNMVCVLQVFLLLQSTAAFIPNAIGDGDPLDLLPPWGSVSARHVYVEIGTSDAPLFLETVLSDDDNTSFLVGVDPAWNLPRRRPHHDRVVLLPAVIANVSYARGSSAALLRLQTMEHPECNSLLMPNSKVYTASNRFPASCFLRKGSVEVLAIPLDAVLQRAASFGPIEVLSIDTQGSDLQVVETGGSALEHVRRIVLECQDMPSDRMMYVGQPTKRQVLSRMQELGFYLRGCWPNNLYMHEENCLFTRAGEMEHCRADCFVDPYTVSFHPAQNAKGQLFDEISSWNRRCCHETTAEQAFCWDEAAGFTKETCCLASCFLSVGLHAMAAAVETQFIYWSSAL